MDTEFPGYEISEKLYEDSRTLVYRGQRIANGEPVILKILKSDTATEDELARFRHEYDLISRLHLPGVVKALALEEYQGSLILVMEDIGGTSLDHYSLPMPLDQFLTLAIALIEIVGQIHRQIIHKNINPRSIIWNAKTGQVQLIDFSLADVVPERNITPQPPSALEGTLEYVSPEQTGRMNRVVDYRTDYYSLGVTFYQLLTGRLPFSAPDALGIFHLHIAGIPAAPHEVNADVPEMVSRIVLKLMAKMADDRYQSPWGLKADLERCFQAFSQTGAIQPFELGKEDYTDRLRAPQKLYGRERETEQLLGAFERAGAGKIELFLVAGYAGIGKTALVHEVHRPVAEKRGYYIEGKFDQLQRNIPYFGWIQAFGGFMNYLLMESEEQLEHWREVILSAVGGIGRVLTDVIPNLELIIGSQPDVPALGPSESQNRFNYVFLAFIKGITTRDHPLVVFLDDLQWIDAASLNILETLMSSVGIANILIIGAYRDNEVEALHPLARSIETLRQEKAPIQILTLGNLSEEIVNELIADTLRYKRSQTMELTHLIYSKTGGNPFFMLQTLGALAERQVISYNVQKRAWQWDISALKSMEITDNVVTLMLGKIHKLPVDARRVLPLAACIGYRFDSSKLGIIAKQSEDAALENIQPALREGLIAPLNGGYQFAHDRIQQAAYSLIPDADKKKAHLEIGRLLLKHIPENDHEEQLFTVVDHLNIGSELIQTKEEKLELARLNLRAGSKAKSSAAFSAAAKYFEAGVAMLDGENWDTDYELTLELYTRTAEAAGLVGDFKKTEQLFAIVTGKAKTAVDMVGAYESKMYSCVFQKRLQEVLDTALEILEKLGLHLPAHPSADDIGQAMKETGSLYADIPVEGLANLPRMADPTLCAIMRIAAKAVSAATVLGRSDLYLLITLKAVNLSIRHGNAIESPYFLAVYAVILCGLLRDFDTGYRFGKLAMALLESAENTRLRSRTIMVVYGKVWHFKQPLRKTLPQLETGYQAGLESGDLEYALYNMGFNCIGSYHSGVELQQLERTMALFDESVKRLFEGGSSYIVGTFWQAVLNLLGPCDTPGRLSGTAFDQEKMLPILEQTHNIAALVTIYINQLVLCYLFEDYRQALVNAEQAAKNRFGMIGMFSDAVVIFYDSLARLQMYPVSEAAEQERILKRISTNQQEMKSLADFAPMNFLHKFYLVEAERMRVTGCGMDTLDYYDLAISLARENEFLNEEALANELAAKFLLGRGKKDIARLYMVKAHQCYKTWGASRKVLDIEERYSQLLGSDAEKVKAGEYQLPKMKSLDTEAKILDLDTLMKATHAISSEIEMDKLLSEVMHIVIESAGAQTGFLLMEKDDEWVVSARGDIEKGGVGVPIPTSIEKSDVVSLAVVRYVARTNETVVLDDAANHGEYVNDPHIRQEKTKSLLCAPLLSRGRLIGIFYLENNLTTHAFTPERVQLLEMLLSQAATSLENAMVYKEIQILNRELEQRVADRTSQLEAVNRELEAFSYSVSHDLRAPLRHIDSFVELLEQRTSAVLDEKSRHYMATISDSAKRMGGLIDELLSFSRMGRQELSRSQVDLNMLVQEIVIELESETKGRTINWHITGLPVVSADRTLIRAVLANVISNAIKFTRPRAAGEIEIGSQPGAEAGQVIYVRDNGVGFDMQYAGKLFGVFQRLHRDEEFEGTGIGLATVHRIITRHGGRVWAEGELGHGATFYFALPQFIKEG